MTAVLTTPSRPAACVVTPIPIGFGAVGERLGAFRLCDASALETMRRSLERHGQLTPLVVFEQGSGFELIDGFKRVYAARKMGWSELGARVADVDDVGAKLWLVELGNQRGLTELEQAWLVRSLYREDELSQPEIAVRLGRHKSWVCRRLLLAEALDTAVQSEVRWGLLAPRSAVEISRLPRGNQEPAARLVIGEGMTVSQTARLVRAVLECCSPEAGRELLERFARGEHPFPVTPRNGPRLEGADPLLRDVIRLRQLAGRIEARLLDSTIDTLATGAADLVLAALAELSPVLAALCSSVTTALVPRKIP
jgi:ParB/RepB/Spo0J family partition protein